MKKLLEMFISFFKIGAFTFGGGYAMIPLIEKEVVENKKWIKKEDFIDLLALSQSLPGALAVNCSIFVGYEIFGIIGGLIALLGTILPSLIIIIFIAMFFMEFRDNYWINLAFKGINAAVPMLVLIAVVSLSKSLKRSMSNILMVLVILFLLLINVHPLIIIVGSAVYGMMFLKEKVE